MSQELLDEARTLAEELDAAQRRYEAVLHVIRVYFQVREALPPRAASMELAMAEAALRQVAFPMTEEEAEAENERYCQKYLLNAEGGPLYPDAQ